MTAYLRKDRKSAKPWVARVYHPPTAKYLFLGYFPTQEEARAAVREWKERRAISR